MGNASDCVHYSMAEGARFNDRGTRFTGIGYQAKREKEKIGFRIILSD